MDNSPIALNDIEIGKSKMAIISGKRSQRVKLKLGLQILEGFLKGFGIPSAGILLKFKGASEVSFSFEDVERKYIDIGFLGKILTNRVIDRQNPAAAIFFEDGVCDFLVIDSVITSSDFSISVDRTKSHDFKIDVPAIQNILGEMSLGVEVSTISGYDLLFKGNKHLAFAFSCVRFNLEQNGKISSMPPADDIVPLSMAYRSLPSAHPKVLYSPDRVLLSEKPALLSWDD